MTRLLLYIDPAIAILDQVVSWFTVLVSLRDRIIVLVSSKDTEYVLYNLME